MHSMNQRFFKLPKVESQLQKLQKIVREALEPVEETEGEGIVEDLVDGEEVKLHKGKGKKRKTNDEGKRKAGEGEQEDGDEEMSGMGAKRVKVSEAERS
jgi:hypothetical protein